MITIISFTAHSRDCPRTSPARAAFLPSSHTLRIIFRMFLISRFVHLFAPSLSLRRGREFVGHINDFCVAASGVRPAVLGTVTWKGFDRGIGGGTCSSLEVGDEVDNK